MDRNTFKRIDILCLLTGIAFAVVLLALNRSLELNYADTFLIIDTKSVCLTVFVVYLFFATIYFICNTLKSPLQRTLGFIHITGTTVSLAGFFTFAFIGLTVPRHRMSFEDFNSSLLHFNIITELSPGVFLVSQLVIALNILLTLVRRTKNNRFS